MKKAIIELHSWSELNPMVRTRALSVYPHLTGNIEDMGEVFTSEGYLIDYTYYDGEASEYREALEKAGNFAVTWWCEDDVYKIMLSVLDKDDLDAAEEAVLEDIYQQARYHQSKMLDAAIEGGNIWLENFIMEKLEEHKMLDEDPDKEMKAMVEDIKEELYKQDCLKVAGPRMNYKLICAACNTTIYGIGGNTKKCPQCKYPVIRGSLTKMEVQ